MDYKTPGVFIEEISTLPPSVAQVETAIPAFVGHTEKATWKVPGDLRNRPWRITSLPEYIQFFGKAKPENGLEVIISDTVSGGALVSREVNANNSSPLPYNMYYAMQGFFANGGGPCYIVSVGDLETDVEIGLIQGGLEEVAKEDEVTLLVFPESHALISDLTQQTGYADYGTLVGDALEQCRNLQDRFSVFSLPPLEPNGNIRMASEKFRNLSGMSESNSRYGAVYAPLIETTFNYEFGDGAQVKVLRSVNGATPAEDGTLLSLKNTDGAQYSLAVRALNDLPLVLPPAPLVVGQYANVDDDRGVWKAPANVPLFSIVKPLVKITNNEQEDLNVTTTGRSINAIRTFTGKGTLIWGARTLDGNSNEWRYVSVRRYFNFVEESVKKATERFVFEPNDANTWVKVRGMIENFLTLQWRAGALQGPTPEQAFFVRVGLGETMTALDILEGRMNVEIGMAVVRPAEFIILKFSHKLPEA